MARPASRGVVVLVEQHNQVAVWKYRSDATEVQCPPEAGHDV
jgi:hypothetical protein